MLNVGSKLPTGVVSGDGIQAHCSAMEGNSHRVDGEALRICQPPDGARQARAILPVAAAGFGEFR
jgi:hypothetical protein